MTAQLHALSLPGAMLARGFWLYVWRIVTGTGDAVLYVGRTGDSSSANAQSPYVRFGQHLGSNKHANALRRNLLDAGIDPGSCRSFEFFAYGPISSEAVGMANHRPVRNQVAALEKELRDELENAGYKLLNSVHCRQQLDQELWEAVRAAFVPHFPELQPLEQSAAAGGPR